jgi:hypothetical protein
MLKDDKHAMNDLRNDMITKNNKKSLDIHNRLPLMFGAISSILAALPKLGRGA